MNILYIAHRIPYPLNKGDKIRSFHQIRHLSERHTIHLACMINEKEDLQHVKTPEKYCASVDAVFRHKRIAKLLSILALFTIISHFQLLLFIPWSYRRRYLRGSTPRILTGFLFSPQKWLNMSAMCPVFLK